MGDPDDLYKVLGVAKSASGPEIEAAYRDLARRTHPDAGGTDVLFRLVQQAYETLSDPVRRARYDRSGSDARRQEPFQPPPANSGWVRVDEPGSATGGGYPPPPSSGSNTGAPPGGGPPPGWPPPPGRQRPPAPTRQSSAGQGTTGSTAGRFLSGRPWIVAVAAGMLLLALSSAAKSLGAIGVIVLAVGVVAALGSGRARARMALRHAGIGQADYMDGTTFEHFSAEVLRSNGYHVEHVGKTGDYGADLIISNQSGRHVVQVKRYSSGVGVDAVREAAAARAHYGTHGAVVLTNSYFTPHAIALARSNTVELWDRNMLINLASRNMALPPASAPAMFAAEMALGLVVVGQFLAAVVGGAAGTSRRRARSTRRPRRRW